MKKKITLSLIAIVFTTTVFTTKVFTNSSGAALGYTGAPGDGDCTSCHYGSALNSNPGTFKISLVDSIGDTVTGYKTGASYSIVVAIGYKGRSKFGFEATVRKQTNNSATGTITATTGVQYCYGFNGYDKNYITHTYYSNTGPNSRKWTSSWVAPGSNVGNIVFYAAGNAANGDGTQYNDNIYTTKLILPNSSTGIAQITVLNAINIYPSPCSDILHVSYSLREPTQTTIYILDLQGKIVKNISDSYSAAGEQQIQTSVSDLAKGVYFLKIRASGHESYFKIIKE